MPLIKRSSTAARATNIRRLIDEGYPPRQAVAIGYSTQRAARAHNRAGKPPKAPRPPAGTPTDLDLYVLHKELEEHEQRNGQPQPLNAFGATSMGAIRKMLKAGYLAPAIGYPRGYWVTTGIADSALHNWRIRHAGVYGIPANYGQNAAGGRRRNRAGKAPGLDRRALEEARAWVLENYPGLPADKHRQSVFRVYRKLKDPATRAPNQAGKRRNRAGKRSRFAVVYSPATTRRGPLYWSGEPGSYARSVTHAWKTYDRDAAERFADEYGGTVVELPVGRR